MPTADYYLKLMIGDAVMAAAASRGEIDALREKLAAAEAALTGKVSPNQPPASEPPTSEPPA